jgi:hypothetical protein
VGLVYHTSVDYEPHPFLPLAIHSAFISLLSTASDITSVFNDVHTCEQINIQCINILLIFCIQKPRISLSMLFNRTQSCARRAILLR